MIIKIANLLALLLSEAWFVKNPDFEPGILFIGFLSSLIYQEYNDSKNSNVEKNSFDKELFTNFLNDLPTIGGGIEFIRDFDFSNSFPIENLDDLRNFTRHWDSAEREFKNNELEKIRKELLKLIQQFSYDISMKTAPKHNGFQSVIPSHVEDWNLPDGIKQDIIHLNGLGDKIYLKHQELIRTATKQLHL